MAQVKHKDKLDLQPPSPDHFYDDCPEPIPAHQFNIERNRKIALTISIAVIILLLIESHFR